MHVLAGTVRIGGLAHLITADKEHLGQTFIGIYAGRQGCSIGNLQGDVALPLRLKRRDVNDDAAARIASCGLKGSIYAQRRISRRPLSEFMEREIRDNDYVIIAARSHWGT